MDTYTIRNAFTWQENEYEIEIESQNLLFVELGGNHSGCQSATSDHNDEIHQKCRQIADLIREIEKLNKV